MLSIKVTIPLAFWIWSDRKRIPVKNIPLNLSSKLNAIVTYNGDHDVINEKNLPEYKSYTDVKSVSYVIKSTKLGRYKKTTPDDVLFEKIHEDVLRIHNRHIKILRSKLKAWQFEELKPGTNILRDLDSWKTEYRFGSKGRFKVFNSAPPMTFSEMYGAKRGHTVHIDRSDIEDVSEWLEDGTRNIEVLDELLAQAKAFEVGDNLRLSILNYTSALELALRQYFIKRLPSKVQPRSDSDGVIKEFLRSDSTSLKNKIRVILPLVIDKSWFKDVDLDLIMKVIEARNKIAHEGLIDIAQKFPTVDWTKALGNVGMLIDSLQTLEYLFDSNPEIRHIKDRFYKRFSIYPQVWLYSKYHRTTLEIVFGAADNKSDTRLREMTKEIITIRRSQVSRFDQRQHLTVSFFKYPRERFATYRNGKLHYINK